MTRRRLGPGNRLEIVRAIVAEVDGMHPVFAAKIAAQLAPTIERLMDEVYDEGHRDGHRDALQKAAGK